MEFYSNWLRLITLCENVTLFWSCGPDCFRQTKTQKAYAHLIIERKTTKLQIGPMKDVRGVAGTRFRTDGRVERRTNGKGKIRTVEGHFCSSPPPTSGDNKRLITTDHEHVILV